VTLTVDGSDRDVVRVQVENAGAIAADVQPTLFEAFRRAVATGTETGASGLGLGLYIAREIARAHGGEIAVESASNRTRFEVSLPRDSRAAAAGWAAAASQS
jgi:signal transduction histidine kinase